MVVPLLSVMAPEALPVEGGVKVTEKAALFPEGMVIGKARPLSPNPAPVITSPVIVTSPPVAARVAGICAVEPTPTTPKTKLDGLTESWPEPVTKFMPATFALLTVTDMLAGTKLKELLLGVTLYVPSARTVKL